MVMWVGSPANPVINPAWHGLLIIWSSTRAYYYLGDSILHGLVHGLVIKGVWFI